MSGRAAPSGAPATTRERPPHLTVAGRTTSPDPTQS